MLSNVAQRQKLLLYFLIIQFRVNRQKYLRANTRGSVLDKHSCVNDSKVYWQTKRN